jgi:hypothetical protein
MKLTTCLHLVLKLRMSGAMHLLFVYTFMVRRGTTLPLLSIIIMVLAVACGADWLNPVEEIFNYMPKPKL